MSIEFNKGQLELSNILLKWYRTQNNQTFEYSGYAGTGKTYVIKYIIDLLGLKKDEVLFVAYTGKAAQVLTLNNCYAKTIHSAFYEVVDENKVDEFGNVVYQLGRPVKIKKFKKRYCIDNKIKLIVVDECGMVPEYMSNDLLSFGVPIVAMGDLFQLPPVYGKPAFLQNPDFNLTEIMRQSEGDPIVHLSTLAREGKNISLGSYGDKCFVIEKKDITDYMLQHVDIVICGRNKTKHDINRYIRNNIYGIDSYTPVKKDKIICRKNNWLLCLNDKYPLINGMIGNVVKSPSLETLVPSQNIMKINFRPDFIEDDYFSDLSIDLNFLNDTDPNKNEKSMYRYNKGEKFEYGYAITTHLSQGSQFDSVLAFQEFLHPNINKKLLYTMITRAKQFLILAISKK